MPYPYLEKAASGAFGHFVGYHAIFKMFEQNIQNFWLWMEEEELKMEDEVD